MRENKTFKINVNHGLYIGDLCYVLSDEVYMNDWGKNHKFKDGAYKVENGEYAMVSTAWGDGYYDSNCETVFPVDAGIIGICDLSLCEKSTDYGKVIEDYCGEVSITYDDGTIIIETNDDTIEIYTTYEEDEEEDEEENLYE